VRGSGDCGADISVCLWGWGFGLGEWWKGRLLRIADRGWCWARGLGEGFGRGMLRCPFRHLVPEILNSRTDPFRDPFRGHPPPAAVRSRPISRRETRRKRGGTARGERQADRVRERIFSPKP